MDNYNSNSFYLILLINFISKLTYYRNYLLCQKNCYIKQFLYTVKKHLCFSNKKLYLLGLTDFYEYKSNDPTLSYYCNKITFYSNLDYESDIINIMFYDILLLEFSRI
jgi:hypothetical protein